MRDTLKLELKGVEHDGYPQKSWEIGGKVPDFVAYDSEKGLLCFGGKPRLLATLR